VPAEERGRYTSHLNLPVGVRMESIDLLIDARWVIPVEPDCAVLENHAVAVRGGRIIALLPSAEARTRFAARERVQRSNHVVVPGFINAHTHGAMSLLRGIADDLPFETWFGKRIWPLEQRWVGAEFVRDGSELAYAEMLLSGTTCLADWYFFPEESARIAADMHVRACIGAPIADAPAPWARGADEYLSQGLALHDAWRDHPLISTALGPHSPYLVSDATFERIRTYADQLDATVMIHLHETTAEIAQSLSAHGVRPIERLRRLGLLSPRLIAVHFVQAAPEDIATAAEAAVSVVHCPESNLKLGNGIAPVAPMLSAGLNVALGTDGAASNNDLDLLGETRTAALLAKGSTRDPTVLDAATALRMATLNGARALGLDSETGSLLPGKWADLCCVNLDAPATLPVYSPLSQLVYAASRDQVSDVWVAGKHLVRDGQHTRVDPERLRRLAAHWNERIAALIERAA
jgi:5-methylthioadenosine/S-adenosylhomocysteine deaminase